MSGSISATSPLSPNDFEILDLGRHPLPNTEGQTSPVEGLSQSTQHIDTPDQPAMAARVKVSDFVSSEKLAEITALVSSFVEARRAELSQPQGEQASEATEAHEALYVPEELWETIASLKSEALNADFLGESTLEESIAKLRTIANALKSSSELHPDLVSVLMDDLYCIYSKACRLTMDKIWASNDPAANVGDRFTQLQNAIAELTGMNEILSAPLEKGLSDLSEAMMEKTILGAERTMNDAAASLSDLKLHHRKLNDLIARLEEKASNITLEEKERDSISGMLTEAYVIQNRLEEGIRKTLEPQIRPLLDEITKLASNESASLKELTAGHILLTSTFINASSLSIEDASFLKYDLNDARRLLDRAIDAYLEKKALGEERLTSIQNMKAKVDEMIQSLEHIDNALPVRAELITLSTKYHTAEVSCTNLQGNIENLNAIVSSADSDDVKLTSLLNTFTPILRISREKTQAIHDLRSQDSTIRGNALQTLRNTAGLAVTGSDLKELEKQVNYAVSTLIGRIVPDSGLDDEARGLLCQLASHTNSNPADMLRAIIDAPQWSKGNHRSALVAVMARSALSILPGIDQSTPAQRAEVMRFVDMLFQGAKYEASDKALALKKMLLPDSQDEVELQHSCMMASSHLFNSFKHLSRTHGSASALSFVLTPRLVNNLSSKVKIQDFNYHLAHVAVLQKQAGKAGLFPLDEATLTAMGNMEQWCLTLGLGNEAARYAGEIDLGLADDTEQSKQLLRRLMGASSHFVRGLAGETDLEKASTAVLRKATMTGTTGHALRERNIFKQSDEYVVRAMLHEHLLELTGLEEGSIYTTDASSSKAGYDLIVNGKTVDERIKTDFKTIYENFKSKFSPGETKAADQPQPSDGSGENQPPHPTPLKDQRDNAEELIFATSEFEENKELVQSIAEKDQEKLTVMLDMAPSSAFNSYLTGVNGDIKTIEDDRADIAQILTEHDAMLQKSKGIGSSAHWSLQWPGHTAERLGVCAKLHDLQQTFDSLAATNPEPASSLTYVKELLSGERMLPAGQLDAIDLLNTLRNQLEGLKGVHPSSLRKSKATAGITPSLDAVMNSMLPRAQAFRYFHLKDEYGKTQAEQKMGFIKSLRADMASKQKVIDSFLTFLSQNMDKTTAQKITHTIQAAAFKAFCESQGSVHTFCIHDEQNYNAIVDQLKTWGMETDAPFFSILIKQTLNSLTTKEGYFDTEALRSKMTKMRLKGTEQSSSEMRRELGIKGLMEQASRPGSGFVYDTSRGLVIDTGKFFHPFQHEHSLVSLIDNVSLPWSINFKALRSNSLTVMHGKGDSYNVILKGSTSAALGAAVKTALSDKGTVLPWGVTAGGQGESGIMLTFGSGKDTENFLRAFMNPKSNLHPTLPYGTAPWPKPSAEAESDGYDPSAWLKATQIKFIHGGNASLDVSIGIMQSLFKEALGTTGLAASGSASGNAALHGDIGFSRERNAHGETEKISGTFRSSFIGSLSTGIAAPAMDKLTSSPLLQPPLIGTPVNIGFSFNIEKGEQGIMPDTRQELEVPAYFLSSDMALEWLLPNGASEEMKTAFRDALNASIGKVTPKKPLNFGKMATLEKICRSIKDQLYGLPSATKVTIKRTIRPEVLKEVRELYAQARVASRARTGITAHTDQERLLRKAHLLLANPTSYEASSLQVKKIEGKKISHNWSPGLAFAQYKRNNSFTNISSDTITIPLTVR